MRIGIDVPADDFTRYNIKSLDMCFVRSTETVIPLPTDYIDVLFTLNAMDHVRNFGGMCRELFRILRPGGDFIGSFNLEEPPSPAEPQTLAEKRVQRLLRRLDSVSYRQAPPAEGTERLGSVYDHFFDGSPPKAVGQRYLWVRGRKPT
jgi:SAM-dependent methyltransferase